METVRRQNLSLLLGHLHRDGAVSRAELTRRTGLNRSTVAALVADLVARDLAVEEEPPASGSAGRPSAIVRPDPDVLALAVNPEVDQLTVGLVGMHAQVRVERRHRFSAVPSAQQMVDALAALLPELLAAVPAARLVGAAVAVPGLVRAADGVVEWAPHLGWTDAPVADLIAAVTGLPVAVGNDATLGAIAEHVFGAGRAVEDLVYLNGGASGIGGGVVVDGRPLGGAGGFAGEFGHIVLPDGRTGVEAEEAVNRDRLAAALGVRSADPGTLHRAVLDPTGAAAAAEIGRQTDISRHTGGHRGQHPQPGAGRAGWFPRRTARCESQSAA